ncbi:MAG: SMI1/KNR4 family protein [Polyangiaceae bacterium]|nr:SMI1/KNR4 family protein [Polyangiaceae bacterium]MCW5790009.1 SMI1/KNR4 family protein [Polyangiaceae bacterium]
MEPTFPSKIEDLPCPFEYVGEPGWAERARAVLQEYGAPLPQPVGLMEVEAREAALGLRFPEAYKRCMVELGPVNLDDVRLLAPRDVATLEDFYARELFNASLQSELTNFISIAEYCGTDDPFVVHVPTGRVFRVGHDPVGLSLGMESFDALLRYAFLGLACGYYGFPDASVEELVEEARAALTKGSPGRWSGL